MPCVFIFCSGEAVIDAAVKDIHSVLCLTTTDQKVVSIGLSGGSMPAQISPSLISLTDVNWSLVHFFFCDERVVPLTDSLSTFCAYQNALFSKLSPPPIVHKIDLTATTTKMVAERYEADIQNFFGTANGYPSFDLLLLGAGADGHTCSLFPHHHLLKVEDRTVVPITDSPKPPSDRVTLTFPVINKAKKVIFIVTGEDKAPVMKKIIEDCPSERYPASMVQPLTADLSWYLDTAAAKQLTSAN